MYLIRYHLITGTAQHYAPSTAAAIAPIEEIEQGAGTLVGVTRTSDMKSLTLDDLKRIAEPTVGPVDDRTTRRWTEPFRRILHLNSNWLGRQK